MLPAAALSATPVDLSIPPQPREDALLALGRQSGLSIGFAPDARCGGVAGVSGRMTVDAALSRLLQGSACEAIRPDARTVVIRPRRLALHLRTQPSPPPSLPVLDVAPAELGEVVVTAEKRESLLSSSASGLSAISGAELARLNVADAQTLALMAAGVTVTNLGPGRNKILLRGVSDGPLTGHTQSTVGIYLGDLRLTYNAPDPDLPYLDLARIEVLRGPQGSLYGSGSIGGVLHIVPNAPDPRGRSGVIALSAADTAHGDPSFGGYVVANQPLLAGRGAVRLVAWSHREGGAIDDQARGLSNIDRTRRHGLRLSGLLQPGADLELDATLVVQNIDTRDAQYAQPAVAPLARAVRTAEPHDNDFAALSVSGRWSPAWGRLTASIGALDHDVSTTSDAAGAPPSLVPPGAQPGRYRDENEIRGVVGEMRLASVDPSRLQWIVGAFGAFGRQRLDAALTTTAGTAGYQEARRDKLLETALFGEASWDVTPDLTATLGGRVFASELRTSSVVSPPGAPRLFSGRNLNRGFAPMGRIAWRPREGLTLYVLTAEGYRTQGFNTGGPAGQRFGTETDGLQPLRRYGGDELTSYEGGARWRSADGHVSARAAVFLANWQDIQADLLMASGLPFTANLGTGQSRGVEAEATVRRGELLLSASVVAQDPELRTLAAGLPGRAETALPGVARLTWSLSATRAFVLPRDWDLALDAAYTHVGGSRLTFDAAAAPRMGDYGDLRLGAALAHDGLRLAVRVENALDGHGDTLAFGNPFQRSDLTTTPQRPRTVRLEIQRAF